MAIPVREYLRSKLVLGGLALIVFGAGPLITILIAARLGMTRDPNPNPVMFGMLAALTFWPGILCTLIGIHRVRTALSSRRSLHE